MYEDNCVYYVIVVDNNSVGYQNTVFQRVSLIEESTL